jgi:hypothetical protein
MHIIIAAVVAFGVGVFCPGVCRKIKAAFGKEVKAVDTAVTSDVKAEIKKI